MTPSLRRGRAETGQLGLAAHYTDLTAELTITVAARSGHRSLRPSPTGPSTSTCGDPGE